MSANPSIRVANNQVEQSGGAEWYRLHAERENVCEALLKEYPPGLEHDPVLGLSQDEVSRAKNWHRELLQSRLRKIDDALDRLMAGSYGNCSNCGRWIEDTKLDVDPAVAFCIACWERMHTH